MRQLPQAIKAHNAARAAVLIQLLRQPPRLPDFEAERFAQEAVRGRAGVQSNYDLKLDTYPQSMVPIIEGVPCAPTVPVGVDGADDAFDVYRACARVSLRMTGRDPGRVDEVLLAEPGHLEFLNVTTGLH